MRVWAPPRQARRHGRIDSTTWRLCHTFAVLVPLQIAPAVEATLGSEAGRIDEGGTAESVLLFWGLAMSYRGLLAAAAVLGMACALALPVRAAAPVDEDPSPPAASAEISVPPGYALDTEMVVRNWVLCVSQSVAEDLVRARETSVAAALKAYDDFSTAKSCGQFAELRVILQTPLYAASIAPGRDAQAFEALVNLTGSWASAYVVSGSLPDR